RNAPLAGIEILDAHGPRIVAKGAFGVEFDEALRAGAFEEIFAGYFSGLNGAFWNVRIETQGDHVLRCRQNIAVANDQVEIDVAPHRGVAVSQERNQRTFHEQRLDAGSSKIFQEAEQLRGHAQGEEVLRAEAGLQLSAGVRGNSIVIQLLQAHSDYAQHAMPFGQLQQHAPIQSTSKATDNPVTIG